MIDEKTGAQVNVSCRNYAIHVGKAFALSLATDLDGFDKVSPMTFAFTTPNTAMRVHMLMHGSANLAAILQIYEDTGVQAQFKLTGGTSVTPINKNRNNSTTSVSTVKHTPTIDAATDDALIHERYAGKAGSHEAFEFILKQNTQYLFRFLTLDDDNEGSLNLDWIECKDRAFVGSVGAVEQ